MKKLSLIDDTFLRRESPKQPLHIGVLLLAEPPANANEDFVFSIAENWRSSNTAAGIFNRILVSKNGRHYWDKNPQFDLEYHFVHLALPRPKRVRELLAMVSRLHCGHLDRAYPLWRIYLIEGLEDGRVAVYIKIHHSLIDGVGLMDLLAESTSDKPRPSTKLPPFWEIDTGSGSDFSGPEPSLIEEMFDMPFKSAKRLQSALPVLKRINKNVTDFYTQIPGVALGGTAPKCSLNQSITGTRRFCAQSFSRVRLKAIASRHDATTNDVVLAMVAGGLRKYLLCHSTLPRNPLIAGVPVSLRGVEGVDTNAANHFASTMVNLATDLDDPIERLKTIKRSMDYNKEQIAGLTAEQIQTYAYHGVIPVALASLLFSGDAADKPMGNLTISHVRGAQSDSYWQGAKVSGVYPISLLLDPCGINVSAVSREHEVDFGIIACRMTVPHVQRLLDYLEESLQEMEDAG